MRPRIHRLACFAIFASALLTLRPGRAAEPEEDVQAPRMMAPCDSAKEWPGMSADAALKKQGRASLTMDLARHTHVKMANPPKDWSTHGAIQFWVHNKKAGPYYFYFLVFSENDKTKGPDYYGARVVLNFSGWRRFVFPRKVMGRSREPLGWDRVNEVAISTTWGEQKIDPTMQFHIDSIEMVDFKMGKGPNLTDEELFDAFDLTREGLEATRLAVQGGDMQAARHALAEYMRNRKIETWHFSPHEIDRDVRYNRERADDATAGKVRVCGVNHAFPDGKIDWAYNATDKRDDMAYNPEWQWQLGRMSFWKDMGLAYWATGDEKYAKAWADQLRSWVRECPQPPAVQNSRWSSWRTIECGIRMARPWPEAFHRFITSPSVTDDVIVDYLKSTVEHGRYLEAYPSSTGNWLALETEGLYTIGVAFPELKQAAQWRKTGVDRMARVLREQLLPDGWQYEIATGYSQMTVRLTLNVYRLAQKFGYLDEVPDDYYKAMEKSYNMTLYFAAPDRRQPGVNDSGQGNAPALLDDVVDLFPHRKDFLWMATDGAKGSPPEKTSYAFEHAGYYVMRSGWGRQANYLMLDAGTLGMAHVHQDKLHLVLWAWGRRMLFDSSGYTYDESKWRRYGTSSYVHSTVIVDGLGQQRDRGLHKELILKGPVDARWETTPQYDFAAGYYDEGYGEVNNNIARHTRRVLFLKPDLFVVADTLESRDGKPHEYQARWQIITPNHVVDPETGIVRTTDKNEPNLAVVPLLKAGLDVEAVTMRTQGDHTQIMGFSYRGLSPVPATTALHTRKGPGVQQMLTVLAPLRVGDDDLVRAARATGPASGELTFSDGRRLAIEADPDPSGGISVRETKADGSQGRCVVGGK